MSDARPTGVVAVIARLPRPGESKTRLAADLGDEAAARLQEAFVLDELDALASAGWSLALLHDRPRNEAERAWLTERETAHGRPVRLVETPGDDLNAALLQGMRALLAEADAALIVAADVPTVGQEQAADALARLSGGTDVVLGHSGDGGYYLVGMREPRDVFSGVPMGTTEALPATERLCAARGLSTARVGEVPDVDTLDDLQALAASLQPAHAPRTAALLRELLPEDETPPLPRALHLELTNRCNLECRYCLVGQARPEPRRDLSRDEALTISDGLPDLQWAALHLNGESLCSPHLVPVTEHLAGRGVTTVLNTNGLLLQGLTAAALLESGLSELRVSVPAPRVRLYAELAGQSALTLVEHNVAMFTGMRRARGAGPRVTLWLVATRESLPQLEDLVELAARVGADAAYVQRLVWTGRGLATPDHAVGPDAPEALRQTVRRAEARAAELGVALQAPGNLPPSVSLFREDRELQSWRACRRPWYTAAVTAHGTVLPCCIASFSGGSYEECALGNVLSEGWEAVWEGERYRWLRRALRGGDAPAACRGCGPGYSP